jgi:GNAT superfamily N-acetyltransferase
MDLPESALQQTAPNNWEISYQGAECFLMTRGEYGHIYHLHVPESRRTKGIGGAMLRRAIRTLEGEDNITRITTQIRETDGSTEQFLQKHGFSTTPHTASNPDRIVVDGVLNL